MASEFQREYLVRLPLPLAQLYSRAHNAKDARGRHDNTFYLFEALVKLAAAPLIAAYLQDVAATGSRIEVLDRLLAQLALPSLGQWLAMLRELARHFGQRPDASSHPLGHLWQQLDARHRDRPALLALFRRIKNGPDGEAAADQSCSLLHLLDALVQYRNGVFGHGAGRFASFYEQEMGPLLFPAVNEVLAEGTFDLLGPRGSRLVSLTELRTAEDGTVEVGLRELVGLQGERLAALRLPAAQAQGLLPGRVAVLWPGRPVPLRLDPLVQYRESELAEEVLFLNRDRNGRQAEYLSYTTGRTERDRATAPEVAALLSRIIGREVRAEQLQTLAEQSAAATPSVELLLGEAAPAGQRLGDYEVLGEIGRGGMGVVYLARQLSLGRQVALKMLPADVAGDEVALARFRREVRHLARCEHPHIVKVLSGGVLPDGQHYYAMEYVPGCDLEGVWRELSGSAQPGGASTLGGTTWSRAVLTASRKRQEHTAKKEDLEKGKEVAALLDPPTAVDDPGGYVRRVVQLVRDAAWAVQAVHEQHIVHRDVKPANLMLTPDGSRLVLMDFGLAKGESLSLSASRSGGLLGTLRYAAPEQLAAASLKVGPAADVRGLGVTLWELLTRRRLFGEAADERQLASLVHEQDVPRLRSIDPSLDRDLEAIVARATERRVADRIATARQLAEYLQLYLEGKPLPIRPPTTAEMVGRWVRAHKPLVGSVAAAALVILATAVTGFVLITRSRNAAVQAFHQQEQAEKDRALAQVEALLEASPEAVPTLIDHLKPFRQQITPRLRELWDNPELRADQRPRVALALLSEDPGLVGYLFDQLQAAGPDELPILRKALDGYRQELAPRCWEIAEDEQAASDRRFRAACALAAYDPTSPRWEKIGKKLAARLVTENPLVLGRWTEVLRPVGDRLIPALAEIFRDGRRPEAERSLATTVLAQYAAGQPRILADLILDADTRQYAQLLPLLQAQPDQGVSFLNAELDKTCSSEWIDAPLDPAWMAADPVLAGQIEQAQGMVTERFVLCQALPLDRFTAVAQGLRRSGYRPIRLRPYEAEGKAQTAAVWTRDGRDWQMTLEASANEVRQRDADWKKQGYVAVDVAGYVTEGGEAGKTERYAALWVKAPSSRSVTQMLIGLKEEPPSPQGFGCETFQQMVGPDGLYRYSSVWSNEFPAWRMFWGQDEPTYEEKMLASVIIFQVDVCWCRAAVLAAMLQLGHRNPERQYAGVWHFNSRLVSQEVHGLDPVRHLQRCRELATEGWRPAALSIAQLAKGKAPLAASVWQQPMGYAVREALAKRQAQAAVTLFRLGRPERLWPLLRHSPDPRRRTWLIHRLASLGADPSPFLRQLKTETDISTRRALILCLGELSEKVSPLDRQFLSLRLLQIYRDDPDPGIHAATEWLLRRGHFTQELAQIDREGTKGPAGDRHWFVNSQGQTLAVVPGPVEFRMGSSNQESDRDWQSEILHRERIPRSFAIGTKPVTIAQFTRFLKAFGFQPNLEYKYSPSSDGPVVTATWFLAAQYCRWLSEQEGVAEDQMCYPKLAEIKPGMKLPADYLQRTGYRLPTEAEWEYTCRAGAVTSRFYGDAEELLGNYAWYTGNARERTWPVGQLKPNDLGMFDIHGHVWEWCQDGVHLYPGTAGDEVSEDREEDDLTVKEGINRIVRGGSFDRDAPHVRCACRLTLRPTDTYLVVGLRLTRTVR